MSYPFGDPVNSDGLLVPHPANINKGGKLGSMSRQLLHMKRSEFFKKRFRGYQTSGKYSTKNDTFTFESAKAKATLSVVRSKGKNVRED